MKMRENSTRMIRIKNNEMEQKETNLLFENENKTEKSNKLRLVQNSYEPNNFESISENKQIGDNKLPLLSQNQPIKIILPILRNQLNDKQKMILLPIFRKVQLSNFETVEKSKITFLENGLIPFKNEKTKILENLRKQIKLKNEIENCQINESSFEQSTFLRLIQKSSKRSENNTPNMNILPSLYLSPSKKKDELKIKHKLSMDQNLKAIYANLCKIEIEKNAKDTDIWQQNLKFPFNLPKNDILNHKIKTNTIIPFSKKNTIDDMMLT